MVKTGLTAAGGLLTAAGAGLMVGVALMETFVVVHVPETGKCGLEDDTIAQIGVYTSSYDPKCAKNTAAFATFSRIKVIESSPTLEFPLLFPTQSGFGGALGDKVGEFDTCEDAWAANSALSNSALSAGVQGLFTQLIAGVSEDYKTLDQKLAGNIFFEFNKVVNGLWQRDVELIRDIFLVFLNRYVIRTAAKVCKLDLTTLETALASESGGVIDFENKQCEEDNSSGSLKSVHTKLGEIDCTDTSFSLEGDAAAYCLALEAYNNQFQSSEIKFGSEWKPKIGSDWELSPKLMNDITSLAKIDYSDTSELLPNSVLVQNFLSFTNSEKFDYDINKADANQNSVLKDALCVLIQLDSTKPDGKGIFVKANEKNVINYHISDSDFVCNFDFTAKVLQAQSLDALSSLSVAFTNSETDVTLTHLVILLDILNDCEATIEKCVSNLPNLDGDVLGLKVPAKFSALKGTLAFFKSWLLKTPPKDAPGLTTGLTAAVGVLTLCDKLILLEEWRTTYVNDECKNLSPRPDDCSKSFVKDFANKIVSAGDTETCATIFPSSSLENFCGNLKFGDLKIALDDVKSALDDVKSALGVDVLPPSLLGSSDVFPDYKLTSTCISNAPTYIAAGATPELVALRDGLTLSAANSLLEGGSRKDLIKSCNDDEKDIEVFETAQMMVPAAFGCASVGMLLSFAAVATQKMPVALVGGLLSVAGGVILMGALLYIQSEAPVYKKLKESADAGPQAGELYYQGGQSQLLALAAVGSSVVGGLVTIGSAFSGNGDEESSALTSKVDNTY